MSEPTPLSPAEGSFWDDWMRAQRLLVRELDRALQRDYGISKAEFSILVILHRAPEHAMRVTDVADALDADKGQVANQITRMERRGLLQRSESGAAGRRTAIALTETGLGMATRAIDRHGHNIRRLALDRLTPDQAAAIGAWSGQVIQDIESDARSGGGLPR